MIGKDPSTRHSLNYYYNGQIGDWNIDFNADGLWNVKEESQHTREIMEKRRTMSIPSIKITEHCMPQN